MDFQRYLSGIGVAYQPAMKTGIWLVTVWSGLNFLVGAAVLVMTLLGKPPPALALVMTPQEIVAVSPKALAVVNAQAAIANPLICAVCVMTTVLLWGPVRHQQRWAWHTLVGTLVPVQVCGFVSDSFLGGTAMAANIVSSVVLGAGLLLCRARSAT